MRPWEDRMHATNELLEFCIVRCNDYYDIILLFLIIIFLFIIIIIIIIILITITIITIITITIITTTAIMGRRKWWRWRGW